jgi:methylmalonyl-CoA/ethylmalonyl-CoA epimerase
MYSIKAEESVLATNGGARLHHIGYVVQKIEDIIEGFACSLDASWDRKIFHDPIQQVHVAFLSSHVPGAPMLELVAPQGDASPVTHFLSKGGGLHHLCYEVDDLTAALNQAKAAGGIIVGKPVPAVAFGGRRIAWFYTKYNLLLEYLERMVVDKD